MPSRPSPTTLRPMCFPSTLQTPSLLLRCASLTPSPHRFPSPLPRFASPPPSTPFASPTLAPQVPALPSSTFSLGPAPHSSPPHPPPPSPRSLVFLTARDLFIHVLFDA
ncbi:hypothetical protein GGF50DRAFT_122065 [Schizophyllum commune]